MTSILESPVADASAWRAADLQSDRSWLHQLSDADIAELETAAAAVRRTGSAHLGFSHDDFVLPHLGAKLRGILQELEDGRGLVVIRGLQVPKYDRETIETIYWGLGGHLGTPISQNAKGQRLAEVKDRGYDYGEINARGYTTRARLLPHVDTSDLTALLCLHPAKEGGLSSVASSTSIYNDILARHPEYLDVLCRGFQHDLRGEGVSGSLEEVTHNRVPVYSYFADKLSCSFNYKITASAAEKLGQPLTELERAALEYIIETAERPDIRFDIQLRQGDIQFINNYTTLHYRSDFVDYPEPERKRNMLRMWINFHAGRALAPEFADRYNTGARAGVAEGAGGGYTI
jgi:hypothetical protein